MPGVGIDVSIAAAAIARIMHEFVVLMLLVVALAKSEHDK